ncbi:MAG: hypothetical protein K0Q50_208 [Vampirovibrio sp.]|jgi:hypothetical protein|nr:hypothetical protein [Vampirovibrio sp.]
MKATLKRSLYVRSLFYLTVSNDGVETEYSLSRDELKKLYDEIKTECEDGEDA